MKGRIFEEKGRISFNNAWALVFNNHTPTPHGWAHIFTSWPWKLNKIAFTPEDYQTIRFIPLKNKGVPRVSMARSTPEKNYGSTFEEPHENLIFTPKEFHILFFFYSTPKKVLSFCYLPLKNSMYPQPGAEGMDIKMPDDSTVMINSTLEIDLRLDYRTQGHLSAYH